MTSQGLKRFRKELDVFLVIGDDKGVDELILKILLDGWWSLFEDLRFSYDLWESKVAVDAAEGDMENPEAEIEHKDYTDILIFSLEKGWSSKHQDPAE